MLGMSQTGYSKYETGENDIPTYVLIKLSDFYNTSVDYLLGLTDEMRPYVRREDRSCLFVLISRPYPALPYCQSSLNGLPFITPTFLKEAPGFSVLKRGPRPDALYAAPRFFASGGYAHLYKTPALSPIGGTGQAPRAPEEAAGAHCIPNQGRLPRPRRHPVRRGGHSFRGEYSAGLLAAARGSR